MNENVKARMKLSLGAVFVYFLSVLLFYEFRIVNNFFYLRLLAPSIIIGICIYISYQTVVLARTTDTVLTRCYAMSIFVVYLCLWITFIYAIKYPSLHFDTWQVYDTSRYVFHDFGKMDMIRQYIKNTPYEMAFPPVLPTLVASLNTFFNFGVLATIVINFTVVTMLFHVLIRIGQCVQNLFAGVVIGALLLLNPHMISCYVGGSTIPLNILFFTITSYVMLQKPRNIDFGKVVIISIISGLGVLNRFDYIPIAVTLGVGTAFLHRRIDIKHACVYFLIFLIVISPWVYYSITHFDSAFITDNGRRLINIPDTRPTSFFPIEHPALTAFDSPRTWLIESIRRWYVAALSMYRVLTAYTYLRELLVSILTLLVLKTVDVKSLHQFLKNQFFMNRAVFLLLIAVLLQTAAIILTGYPDSRYHILGVFFLFFTLVCMIALYAKSTLSLYLGEKRLFVIVLLVCIVLSKTASSLEGTAAKVVRCITKGSSTADALVLRDNLNLYLFLSETAHTRTIINREEPSLDFPRFSALSRQVTALSPDNLCAENARQFVEFFKFNYIYSSDRRQIAMFDSVLEVTPTSVENLYKIGGER